MKSLRRPAALAILAASLLFSACQIVPDAQPDPTRFYMLEDPALPQIPAPDRDAMTIGLLAVRLPVYSADSRAMAITSTDHRVKYRDFDRWAEPLDKGIQRVLQSALARDASIARVVTLPFSSQSKRDFDLRINIRQCEGFQTGDSLQIRFGLDYSVLNTSGDLLHHDVFQSADTSWNGEPGDLARLLSRAIANAADKVAASLPPRI